MIRRHPHVFGEGTAQDPARSNVLWAESKLRNALKAAIGIADDVLLSINLLRQLLIKGQQVV